MKISKLYFIVMEYLNLFPDIFTKLRMVFESVLSRVPNQESIAIKLMAMLAIISFFEKAKNNNLGTGISMSEISITGSVFTVICIAILFFVLSPIYKVCGKVFGGMDSSDDTLLAIGDACNPLILPLILWGLDFYFMGKVFLLKTPLERIMRFFHF